MKGQRQIPIKCGDGTAFATFDIADIKAARPLLSDGQDVEIAVDFGSCIRIFQATYTRGRTEENDDRLAIKLGHGATILLTESHKCDVSLDRRGQLFYHLRSKHTH